jgi:hypothetical protein
MQKVHFHRNGDVSVAGKVVGTFRQPDPSGAPHARSLIWLFTAFDGEQRQARRRGWLDDAANSAFIRLSHAA